MVRHTNPRTVVIIPTGKTKQCARCKQYRDTSLFTKSPRNRDGLHSYCQPCRNTEKRLIYADSPEFREYSKRKHIRNAYGLTPEQYDAMIEVQGGRCAVCREPLDFGQQTHVDHCHATDRIRGILCHPCNIALGNARDDPQRLRDLADYLERHHNIGI